MWTILKTLVNGANARSDEDMRDRYAIDLLRQKVREAENGLGATKGALADLIVRCRHEQVAISGLGARAADLEQRARSALNAGHHDLAQEAAAAIAELENEIATRKSGFEDMSAQVLRTRALVEKERRRILDLRMGMARAESVDKIRRAQAGLVQGQGSAGAIRDAEALIAKITQAPDPSEREDALETIEASLEHSGIRERLAASGHGSPLSITASDVMARLAAPKA